MITITAFKWVPPFAQGQVRDHRVRWILEEVGWPYEVRLIDAETQSSAAYRADQPFGQVPVLEEDGRPTLFETGAILLDVATRSGTLLPTRDDERALAICWVFAALNSIEPFLSIVAEVEYFMDDEAQKTARRPSVTAAAHERLAQLAKALGDRTWMVGDAFSIADMMLASVLKIARRLHLLEGYPTLLAYQDRCFARPAYQKAIADQCAAFEKHSPADMKYAETTKGPA